MNAMIQCLTEGTLVTISPVGRNRVAIIERFEEFLAANYDRPVYLAEICVATGASERTLRNCCREHLGMAPIRYLWLRRMHLARRALLKADPEVVTVTGIAMDYGFWELGRFAIEYRGLFGESPSATLRRQPHGRRKSRERSLALVACEYA